MVVCGCRGLDSTRRGSFLAQLPTWACDSGSAADAAWRAPLHAAVCPQPAWASHVPAQRCSKRKLAWLQLSFLFITRVSSRVDSRVSVCLSPGDTCTRGCATWNSVVNWDLKWGNFLRKRNFKAESSPPRCHPLS